MINEIEIIQRFFLEKSGKTNIKDLDPKDHEGSYIIPINGKDWLVNIDSRGGISIVNDKVQANEGE
jgi:hypothetical protein